jgi:hypothetical protein
MKTFKVLKSLKTLKSPFLVFLPFLLLATGLVLIYRQTDMAGDEPVYLNYAKDLLKLFSGSSRPLYLGVGPGYPLVILPFIALGLPAISIPLLNAVLFYFSIIFLFKALKQVVNVRFAYLVGLFWALNYNQYEYFSLILPETIAPFFVSLFLYFYLKSFDANSKKKDKYLYLAGFTFGLLSLTKIIFGYVLVAMIIGNLVLWLTNRKSSSYQNGLIVLLTAFLSTVPYLAYTYHVTGRVYYWGTTAGDNMYWMSTPYTEEFGSWFPDPKLESDTSTKKESITTFRQKEHIGIKSLSRNIPGTDYYINFNHQNDFESLNNLTPEQQDDKLKKITISNIKNHPLKYINNCFCNLGRILFNYPYSYTLQRPGTLLRLPPNGVILVLGLFSLIPTLANWKRIVFPIRFVLFVFCLYMGGSLIGSAEARMFTVVIPILLVWISFVLERSVRLKIRFDDNQEEHKEESTINSQTP